MSRSSPRRAKVAIPYSATSAAATSSLVDSGLEAARYDLRAAGLEGPHQVRGLGRHVEAGPDAQALERPLALEALADEAQDRHLPLGPLDPPDALGREAEVGDVVGGQAAVGRRVGVGSAVASRRGIGLLPAGEEAPERRREVWPGRSEPVDEPLLEADVLGVAERAIGLERGRVVGADVEHDLVAGPQQLRGHGAGDGLREAAATVVDVGQDVADDGEPRLAG